MSSARYLIGDTRSILATLPEASVDLVLTSPPFLDLRAYLPADHPDKHLEIGSGVSPAEFIDSLLDVVEACSRVLAPHGSMCFELGDSYSGSGGSGGDYLEGGSRAGQAKFTGTAKTARSARGATVSLDRDRYASSDNREGWPLAKSLCLVPELFRISLVYGFNPLTGRTTSRWRARNVIRWCRPDPPVGRLGDKVRPATSDLLIITKAKDRYFDLDAVRTPPAHGYTSNRSARRIVEIDPTQPPRRTNPEGPDGRRIEANPAGAPPLDHWWHNEDTFTQDAWLIPTQPYQGSHYATWPEKLCETPIKAMCPTRVCTVCGQPSRRITERETAGTGFQRTRSDPRSRLSTSRGDLAHSPVKTIGWTDCGHDNWRTGIVLDPFAGSGTTLAVATGHGRHAIGIDLDPRNATLALDRVGPLILTVESEAA